MALPAALVVSVLAGCGSARSPVAPTAEPAADSSVSHPFTVGTMPDGFAPITAGTGTQVPRWGDDSGGTDEPFTVFSRDGTATDPEVVVVSITGFEGYQGRLSQAGRGRFETQEAFSLDGRDAIYHAPWTDDRGDHWADLVVASRSDLAVRVTSPEATREELSAWVARVEPPIDHGQPPAVSDPPGGLEVVGSMTADAVVARWPDVQPNTDVVPGTAAAHGAGWRAETAHGTLSIVTLPGDSVDLAALPLIELLQPAYVATWTGLTISGQPAMAMEALFPDAPGSKTRSVWLQARSGDVVVVTARGLAPPSPDELAALAASVEPANDDAWNTSVIAATGGPGLHADDGRAELARGTVGDLEWLLQNGPQGGGGLAGEGIDPNSLRGVDPCLKLSNRHRACAGPSGTIDDWVAVSYPGEDGVPGSFVVISTTLDAGSVRITTASAVATGPLHEVPGGGLWGAVVFVDDPGPESCQDDPSRDPAAYSKMRVEALDEEGNVIACLGLGPGSHVGGL